MRRSFILIFMALILGCGPPQPRDGLNVAMSLSEDEWKVFREDIFPRFTARTHIPVNAYQISSQQLAAKLQALKYAGKSQIDVFAQDNMDLADLVNKKLVCDLSADASSIPKTVYPNLIDAGRFNGRLLFMPFRPNVQIAYFNKEAFQKYQLDPPRNWDGLMAVGKVFKEKEGTGRLLIQGYGGNATATQMYEFILQAGGDPYAFNDAGCIKAFSFLQRLKAYLSPESWRAKEDSVNDILARKEAFLAQNWPFGAPILVKDYGLNFISAFSGWGGPAGERHVIGGDVLGVPQNAAFKDRAMAFIFFLQSKEVQEILVKELGWPSIRADAYAQVAGWQRPFFTAVQEAMKKGDFRKNVIWWPAYEKYINLAFRQIVIEGKDVRQTLANDKQGMEGEKPLYQ